MPLHISLCWLFGVAFALAGAGCGGPKSSPVKVNGKVTLDGTAFAGATVTFVPLVSDGGRDASGRSDSSGAFELTTFKTDDGALPGEYKVIVSYKEEPKDGPRNAMQMDEKQATTFFKKMSPEGRAHSKELAKKVHSPLP